jgi:hypothetical protein
VERRFERDCLAGRFCKAAKAACSSSEVGGVEQESAEWEVEEEEAEEEAEEEVDLSSGGANERGGSMSIEVGGEEKGVKNTSSSPESSSVSIEIESGKGISSFGRS